MKFTKRTFLLASAAMAVGATGLLAQPASAQEFPSKTIKHIVPYSAGGGQDRWSRVLASAAIDYLGQAIHVQVRGGAGGTIGWKYLLDQPADGHTTMIGSMSPMTAVMTEANSPIKISDVKMVCVVSDYNVHLMAQPNSEFDSWEKISAYAKANPGKLTVGGTLAQLLGAAAVFDQAKIDATFVPYPGTSKAVADLLGGHVTLAVVTPATVLSLGDKAVSIANLGIRADSDSFKKELGYKVPWVGDMGYKGVPQPRWIGVHPDTPDDKVAKLAAGFKGIVGDKSVQRLVKNLGEEVQFLDTAEAQQTYDDLIGIVEKYSKLLN